MELFPEDSQLKLLLVAIRINLYLIEGEIHMKKACQIASFHQITDGPHFP